MDPSVLISWTSPFAIIGVPGVYFHFYSISNRNSCKQTAASDLSVHCLPRFHLWALGTYGLIKDISC